MALEPTSFVFDHTSRNARITTLAVPRAAEVALRPGGASYDKIARAGAGIPVPMRSNPDRREAPSSGGGE